MTNRFESMRRELETYLPALVRMYAIEEMLGRSDLRRWMPERAHAAARHAAGIPDHVSVGRELLDETEEEWLKSCV